MIRKLQKLLREARVVIPSRIDSAHPSALRKTSQWRAGTDRNKRNVAEIIFYFSFCFFCGGDSVVVISQERHRVRLFGSST